jgi:hypothetical protein
MKSLTILIPTLPDRTHFLTPLIEELNKQIGDKDITIKTDFTGKELSIGSKRQKMLLECTSDYVAHIDDDDEISDDYIDKIYEAIQKEPDVVGFNGWISTDGQNKQNWSISTKYNWAENQDGFRYVRYPNHLSPIKTELAKQSGFKDMKHGEDFEYSMALKRSGNLKNQVFIDSYLYHYKFRSIK